jgi:hypothetical protein
MPRKRNEDLLFGNTDRELNTNYKRIEKFRPLNAQSISQTAEGRVGKDGGVDRAIIAIIREQTREQLLDVLRSFSVEPADPDAWQKGFQDNV